MTASEIVNQPVKIRAENAEWIRSQPVSLSALVRNAIERSIDGAYDPPTDRRQLHGRPIETTSVRLRRRHVEHAGGNEINLSAMVDDLIDRHRDRMEG